MERPGHLADLPKGGDAHAPHLRLNNIYTAVDEARLVLINGAQLLADGDRRFHALHHASLAGYVFRRNGGFGHIEVIRFKLRDELDGLHICVAPVKIDQDFGARASYRILSERIIQGIKFQVKLYYQVDLFGRMG
jgi:hypothetical protein